MTHFKPSNILLGTAKIVRFTKEGNLDGWTMWLGHYLSCWSQLKNHSGKKKEKKHANEISISVSVFKLFFSYCIVSTGLQNQKVLGEGAENVQVELETEC